MTITEQILHELGIIAFTNVSEFYETFKVEEYRTGVNDSFKPKMELVPIEYQRIKPMADWGEAGKAVSEIKINKAGKVSSIKLHNKQAALSALLEIYGEELDLEGKGKETKLKDLPEARKALEKRLRALS